jgi:hypothetical protein
LSKSARAAISGATYCMEERHGITLSLAPLAESVKDGISVRGKRPDMVLGLVGGRRRRYL